MSDEKPFAEIKPETRIADAEGFSVVVEGEELCPPWSNWEESEASGYAAKFNSAVTARERKAAAKALREAIHVARGCLDYGGGYRNHGAFLEAFHHGIKTVIAALEAKSETPDDPQVRTVEAIGRAAALEGGA